MSAPSAARRVVVRTFGGPEQLQLEPLERDLRPGPGELVVDVEAAGVNYLDVYQRQGIHGAALPLAPGLEGARTR